MNFRALGPFEVVAADGPVHLGSRQQRAVLALLVLRANELVSTDAIVDGIWPSDPPRSAVGVVRTYVSRLRRALADAGITGLVGRPPGYVLEIETEAVDVRRFERLVDEARRQLDAGRPDRAATGFREALGLWRGEVLADMPWLAAVRPMRTRLEQVRLAAVEDGIGAELDLGRHGDVVGELEALTGQHPFRERLWAHLMVALYRSGRQRDALHTYQRARTVLVGQAGIEPGPELRAVEQQILDHSEALRPPSPFLERTDDGGRVGVGVGVGAGVGAGRYAEAAITGRRSTETVDLRPVMAVGDGREAIERRLRDLPQSTASLLDHAAVLGVSFAVPLLAEVADAPAANVLESLEPAVSAGLVDRHDAALDQFRFADARVRDVLLARAPAASRAHSHWRAGQAIARRHAADLQPHLVTVAQHLAAGASVGIAEVAVDANVRAGQQALAVAAYEEAADRFTAATDLIDAVGLTDPVLAYEAWLGLGRAVGAQADGARQRRAYLRAVGIAREQGWPHKLARAAVGFVGYAVAASAPPRPGGANLQDQRVARRLVEEALACVPAEPTPERCLLLAAKAFGSVVLGRRAPAEAAAGEAVAVAEALGDPASLVVAQAAYGWSQLGRPHRPEFAALVDGALSQRASPESWGPLAELVLSLLPLPALQMGERMVAAAMRDRVAAHPEARRRMHLRADLQMWDGALALCSGDLDEAERLAGTLPGADQWAVWESVSQLQTVVVGIERGQDDAVARWLSRYLVTAPDALAPRAMLASACAATGDSRATAAHVQVLRRSQALDDLGWSAPIVLRHLAEVAARLGDEDLAAELLPIVSAHSGQMLVSFMGATVDAAADRPVGQLLAVVGLVDDAIEHLRAAHALERSFDAGALETRTAYWLADALLRRARPDDVAEAAKLLDHAVPAARRLGMTRLHDELESLATNIS